MAKDETRRRTPRLDQPVVPRRGVPRPSYDPDAFGRLSERIARFLGTGRFLVFQSAFILVWVIANVALPHGDRFDRYPFQFLTLVLSLQAAYAAPLILLAQNRQDDRDRVNLEQDRLHSEGQSADTEFVARELAAVRIALGDVVTRDFLRSELRAILDEDRHDADAARKEKKIKKVKRAGDPAPGAVAVDDADPADPADPAPERDPPNGLSSPPG